ncbi:MAG TPA: hypothetical protein VMN60_07690 [Longimicrobiales bacterium]|nr:hypothetical protein [Longimicrobiales bacterium]
MMRKFLIAAVAVLVVPIAAPAQSLGVSARAGSLGIGGELSLGLTGRLAVRGGIGVLPFEVNRSYSDVDYTIEPTSPLANVGIDFYPGLGGLHIGGGLLLVSQPTTLTGEYTGTVDIGGRTYTGAEVGTLTGELDHGSSAPYLLLGFGRHTGAGFGFFADLGAAFMKDPALTLEASGPAANNQQFQDDLERERAEAEADAKEFLKILPILSLGVRIGIR